MLKLKSTLPAAVIIIISTIFLFITSILGKPYKPPKELLTKINFIGTYRLENDNFVHIVNDESLKSIPTQRKIIFEGHLDKNIKACEHLFFRMHYLKADIFKNGKKIISKGYNHPAITKSSGNIWEEINGVAIKNTDFLHIELKSDYKYNKDYSYGLFITSLCKGQHSPIIQSEVSKYFVNFIVGILFIIIGMLVLSASTYLSATKKSPKYIFHHLAIFTICSGVWIFIDYNYISLIIGNIIIVYKNPYAATYCKYC
ncbi:MAG: hypothetical protein K6F69_04555 [Treponema sp.]|nr:hypothetical protein [Treponema sp.]